MTMSEFRLTLFALLLILSFQLEGQVSISGKVTDNHGESLQGVEIREKGTSNGTVSDTDGKFSLEISNHDAVLELSFIGYKKLEVKTGEKQYFDLKLKDECFIDFFDYNDLGIGFSSDVLNKPVGAYGYINIPIRRIALTTLGLEYQSDLKNDYKTKVRAGVLHLLADCDYQGDILFDYRKIKNHDLSLDSYLLTGKINTSRVRIFRNPSTVYLGYGRSSFEGPDLTCKNKPGYLFGAGAFTGRPLFLNVSLMAVCWTKYREYIGELKWEFKDVSFSVDYNIINNLNEINFKLGYIFNY